MGLLFGQDVDGADFQAQAVLAYLRYSGDISESYSSERHEYLAKPEIDRWHNCREQGYVITLCSADYKNKIYIAFFEHRNSDSICAVVFETEYNLINPPTINDIPKHHPYYESKWAVDKTVGTGEAMEMAEWIHSFMTQWWKSHN